MIKSEPSTAVSPAAATAKRHQEPGSLAATDFHSETGRSTISIRFVSALSISAPTKATMWMIVATRNPSTSCVSDHRMRGRLSSGKRKAAARLSARTASMQAPISHAQ